MISGGYKVLGCVISRSPFFIFGRFGRFNYAHPSQTVSSDGSLGGIMTGRFLAG
jgi:hypothetical protein